MSSADGAGRVDAVLIAGPTASGKSALAAALAHALGGTVINADAMQLYADLRVLTARPAPDDEAAVAHRLYGVLDGAVRASAGAWLDLLGETLVAERAAGRLPILVGGTGLYLKAATEGLVETPPVSETVRAETRARLAREGAAALHAWLGDRDPQTARQIHPTDAQRILRAIEVWEMTGEGLAGLRARARLAPPLDGRLARFALWPDREALYERIDTRVVAMTEEGAIEEVAALRARQLDPSLPVMKAVGVAEFGAYLDATLSFDAAIAAAQSATRRYAKRQFTWIRHQMQDWHRLTAESAAALEQEALAALRRDG